METEVISIFLVIFKFIDRKQKIRFEENMKNIYTQMVNNENQKFHPFGQSEKRFNWINNYSNGNDLKIHQKIVRKKDNLEGGIGRFLTKNRIENEKQSEKNSFENNNKRKQNKLLNINSQRVIYPEKDIEVKKVNKIRTYESMRKNSLHNTDGRITTLLGKTPLNFKYRGKRTYNNSVDYGKRKDTNLFSEEFLNDKNYNRIPGVTRKHLIHKVNLETRQLDKQNRIRSYICN
jgi:hypothetical protein